MLLVYCGSKAQTRNQGGGGYGRQELQIFPAVCATCGEDKTVISRRLVKKRKDLVAIFFPL